MNAELYPLVRAIRGPIVLIVLGVLFWLDQSDQVSFGRTWPVLIILIGLMKLIERMVAPAVPPLPPGPVGAVR
jgi:hypothetical protein